MASLYPPLSFATSETLRDALACFATGVAVVTGTRPDCEPVGLTISSFNSVSLHPPMVLWSISAASPSRAAFREGRHFAVNILSAEQAALCRQFARPSADKFDGVELAETEHGIRLLKGAVAWFECVTERAIMAGDHELYLGRVLRTGTDKERLPLIFHRSRLSELPPMEIA